MKTGMRVFQTIIPPEKYFSGTWIIKASDELLAKVKVGDFAWKSLRCSFLH